MRELPSQGYGSEDLETIKQEQAVIIDSELSNAGESGLELDDATSVGKSIFSARGMPTQDIVEGLLPPPKNQPKR